MQKFIEILSKKIDSNRNLIDDWFAQKFSKTTALFYNSVDLRHAEFKIAPVDTNCFPAGFGNLKNTSKEKAKTIADEFLNKNFPNAKKIILIPESHTRNLFYLNNLLDLQEIISAKREVLLGSLIEDLKEKTTIDLENGRFAELHPLVKNADKISTVDGFSPDLIILNNDLTDCIPQILEGTKIPVAPPVNMGWHHRTKSQHFTIYNQLAVELAQLINLDPWLISSLHKSCDHIDFKHQKGMELLAKNTDELLENLRKKYQEYNIKDEPYCFIKADSGTYGIAVWSVSSGKEVLEINKKERNKMNMLKGSVQNTAVVIQEGIKTVDRISDKVAEPMIYMIGGQVVGNLFRVNESRDEKISLNTAGMTFFDLEELTENQINIGATKNQIANIYSLIARLAALAAAIENKNN